MVLIKRCVYVCVGGGGVCVCALVLESIVMAHSVLQHPSTPNVIITVLTVKLKT